VYLLRAGDRFALLGDPSPALVVALYAAVAVGAIPLVPSPLLTVSELTAILQDAEPHMIIHDEHHLEKVKTLIHLLEYSPQWFTTHEENSVSRSLPTLLKRLFSSRPTESVNAGAEDTAVLIYTGGTTGRPKGVMHSHRSKQIVFKNSFKVAEMAQETGCSARHFPFKQTSLFAKCRLGRF
jgi:acyl-CoA synthetase (AMP-forming)/AMP-acid ligase II